ncbi:MAG: chemotaxis protein CheD [Sterolibacteriaceae bacterium MAG5]|nr:chemotaxis protein CheD [Candidatus Nitricoxidireducens bremensis]
MSDLTHLTGKDFERIARNINPGGWAIETERPISTLLGSCVAVCLFDARLKIGGMNHFLLPSRASGANADTDVILNGDFAMEVLVNALLNKGASKARLVAKAFGGGTIVSSIRMAIGERNSEFAREWLEREGIPLVASDFSGPWSRKVIFVPQTGDAFCRRMPTTQATVTEVVKAEQEYEQSLILPKKPVEKKIELF